MITRDEPTPYLSPWIDKLGFDWSLLETKGKIRFYKKHDILFHFQEPVSKIYIVKEGRIRLFLTSYEGREKAVAIIGENGLLGESSIFQQKTYNCSAIAATTATIIEIPVKKFEEVISENNVYMKQMLEMMSLKIRLLTMHTVQLSFGMPFQRLCEALFHLAVNYGVKENDRVKISITFTHQELADLIGSTRVTIVNHLKELKKQGVISRDGKYYHIDSLAKLGTYLHL